MEFWKFMFVPTILFMVIVAPILSAGQTVYPCHYLTESVLWNRSWMLTIRTGASRKNDLSGTRSNYEP